MPGRILFEDYHALRMVKGPAPAARTRILKTAGVHAHVSRPSRTFTLLCGVRERREPETRGHHPADIGAGLICYSRSRSRLVHPKTEWNGSLRKSTVSPHRRPHIIVRSARNKGAYLAMNARWQFQLAFCARLSPEIG